jgi:hypothetical protein
MKELIKPLIILAAIITVSAIVAQVLLSGETIQDYAEKNPDLAFASPEPEAAGDDLVPEDDSLSEAEDETALDGEEVTSELIDGGEISPVSMWSVAENMFEFEPGFYREPLSDHLFAYIRGISYPVTAAEGPNLPNVVADIDDIVISREELSFLTVLHYDFNGDVKTGELICNIAIADDLLAIFYELYRNEYRIEKIRLIEEYGGDDGLSMMDNNTSCFNYRDASPGNLSNHAYGLAIDINPFYNPYVSYNSDGRIRKISPEGSDFYADRRQDFPYKIDENALSYRLFKEHGFFWGGDWNFQKDYQHFQKTSN